MQQKIEKHINQHSHACTTTLCHPTHAEGSWDCPCTTLLRSHVHGWLTRPCYTRSHGRSLCHDRTHQSCSLHPPNPSDRVHDNGHYHPSHLGTRCTQSTPPVLYHSSSSLTGSANFCAKILSLGEACTFSSAAASAALLTAAALLAASTDFRLVGSFL